MNFLPEEKRPAEVIDWLGGRGARRLRGARRHLAGRDWIEGDGVSNADLTCCGYLFYPEPFGFARADWPNIDRWLAQHRGASRMEGALRPHAPRLPAAGLTKGRTHDRRLHLRRRPHPARQGPRRRQPPRGDRGPALGLTLNALKERNGLEGHAVEDVIWGNATQVGEQGGCLARTAVLASDLDERIPGLSINRFCASGLEAVNLAANQVRAARARPTSPAGSR
jgi:hypothetical protein